MKRYALLYLIMMFLATQICCCAPLKRPLDARSGFSAHLKEAEANIRNENWDMALDSLADSAAAWKRIKPYLQLDIDHDYVNEIEASFVLLRGYLETGEKPHSLALILLVQDIWENIDSM
jgi:hypothetical protein